MQGRPSLTMCMNQALIKKTIEINILFQKIFICLRTSRYGIEMFMNILFFIYFFLFYLFFVITWSYDAWSIGN